MKDPFETRAGMTYFRVKLRRLPPAYRTFLEESLAPGATLVVSDCGLRWPTTSVGPRHVFQHGALGGVARAAACRAIGCSSSASSCSNRGGRCAAGPCPWRDLLARARKIGVFTGVDTRAYSRDSASLAHAHRELSKIRARFPMPLPLDWAAAEEFLAKRDELDWHVDA
ncbi:hypothetical protein [Nonomuraea africana]|uniref:hypothetical protein n=1 Tax=Nonomuraea africana TaxID=46171 RepID=UPI0034057E94